MKVEEYVKPLTPLEEEAITIVEGLPLNTPKLIDHGTDDEAVVKAERKALKYAASLAERRLRFLESGESHTVVKILPDHVPVESLPDVLESTPAAPAPAPSPAAPAPAAPARAPRRAAK